MKWKKPESHLIERFHAAVPTGPDVKLRLMFGFPACFVNGRMFVGMFEDNFIIKTPDGSIDQFPELASAATFNPMGRGKGMRNWYVVPAEIADSTEALAELFGRAFDEFRRLPVKPPGPKRKPRGR